MKLNNFSLQKYILLQKIRKEQIETNYYEFVIDSFEIINPGDRLIKNWHIKYLCDTLQSEVTRINAGLIKKQDLIINVPPRSLKSFVVSVAFPAWAWLHRPSLKIISSSYSLDLSIEHNMMTRRIIESQWYKNRWGHKIKITTDQNTKSHFENTWGGLRRATSTGGTITGVGGDVIIVDDPSDPRRAGSEIERETAKKHYDLTLSTRLNKPKVGIFIIIMQRLHEQDLTGYLLAKAPEKYFHICLPAEKSSGIKPTNVAVNYKNNLLFEKRYDKEYLEATKAKLGSYGYSGQYMQQPSPAAGGIIKKAWWKFYQILPKNIDVKIQSWDCSFKDKKDSDFVAGQIWGRRGVEKYLIRAIKGRMGIIGTIEAVLKFCVDYPDAHAKLIEDKANGTAVIEVLRKKIPGLKPIEPKGGKEARVMAILPTIEAGNVFLPCLTDPTEYNVGNTSEMPIIENWVEEFIESCGAFPNAEHDDDVDACSQALLHISNLPNLQALNKNVIIKKTAYFDNF